MPIKQPTIKDFRTVARALTIVENGLPGADDLLKNLNLNNAVPVVGITGSPGAGKSTLVDALIAELLDDDKTVAILAVDPTSPFSQGSLLGDRIRMTAHFNHPRVFIRSLATRGALGGLSAKTIEMTDVLRAAGFDYVLVETVGVGQSEVEIADLADFTFLVLVPEGGDEIQNIKAGVMEIADAYIINKADRAGADTYYNTLKKLLQQSHATTPVLKTVATQKQGLAELATLITKVQPGAPIKRTILLAEKAWQLIRERRMAGVDKTALRDAIVQASAQQDFNLYRFIADNWTNSNYNRQDK